MQKVVVNLVNHLPTANNEVSALQASTNYYTMSRVCESFGSANVLGLHIRFGILIASSLIAGCRQDREDGHIQTTEIHVHVAYSGL